MEHVPPENIINGGSFKPFDLVLSSNAAEYLWARNFFDVLEKHVHPVFKSNWIDRSGVAFTLGKIFACNACFFMDY